MHQHIRMKILPAVDAVMVAEFVACPGGEVVPPEFGIHFIFFGKFPVSFAGKRKIFIPC